MISYSPFGMSRNTTSSISGGLVAVEFNRAALIPPSGVRAHFDNRIGRIVLHDGTDAYRCRSHRGPRGHLQREHFAGARGLNGVRTRVTSSIATVVVGVFMVWTVARQEFPADRMDGRVKANSRRISFHETCRCTPAHETVAFLMDR